MKVKDLIEQLKSYDEESQVFLDSAYGLMSGFGISTVEELDEYAQTHYVADKTDPKAVVISSRD